MKKFPKFYNRAYLNLFYSKLYDMTWIYVIMKNAFILTIRGHLKKFNETHEQERSLQRLSWQYRHLSNKCGIMLKSALGKDKYHNNVKYGINSKLYAGNFVI